jgi:hypothetical protein
MHSNLHILKQNNVYPKELKYADVQQQEEKISTQYDVHITWQTALAVPKKQLSKPAIQVNQRTQSSRTPHLTHIRLGL